MKIISLWSGPRNVSTAFMYSFAQRDDTTVIDEPFYAYYLNKTDAIHPGMHEVIEKMDKDGLKVLQEIKDSSVNKPVLFIKNMCHHWIGFNNKELTNFENIFLIRDPRQMLPSLINQIPNPVLRDTGLKQQADMFNYLTEHGKQPLVIDAKALLQGVDETLKLVCDNLSIEFTKNMLSWEPGPKDYDGVWAKHWYHNVHKSEGFSPYSEKKDSFPKQLLPLLEECMPFYNYLLNHSIKT